MLPPGLSQQADTLYTLFAPQTDNLELSPTQARIVALLAERGPLRGRQIERHFSRVDWRKSAEALARRGLLGKTSVLPQPTVRGKFIRTAQLAVPLKPPAPQWPRSARPKPRSNGAEPRLNFSSRSGRGQRLVGVCRQRLQPGRPAGTGRTRLNPAARNRNLARPARKSEEQEKKENSQEITLTAAQSRSRPGAGHRLGQRSTVQRQRLSCYTASPAQARPKSTCAPPKRP
jgi:hypothetical protein